MSGAQLQAKISPEKALMAVITNIYKTLWVIGARGDDLLKVTGPNSIAWLTMCSPASPTEAQPLLSL